MISVITVCLNSQNSILNTINSIISQSDSNFEYIIVDGLSVDNTPNIVKEKEQTFHDKGIKFQFISEKDNGIYEAMNKGIRLACGEWIIFINAGDLFYDNDTIKRLNFFIANNSEYGVVYGDTVICDEGLFKLNFAGNYNDITKRMPFCHQSIITRRDILINSPYSENYKIASDYDFYLKYYLSNGSFKYCDFPISIFQLDGISSQNSSLLTEEYNTIRLNYGLSIINEFNKQNQIKIHVIIKDIIKFILPLDIYNKLIKYKRIKQGWEKSIEIIQQKSNKNR